MPRRPIPEPDPVGDVFAGMLLKVGDRYVLAPEAQPGAEVVLRGEIVIRYGVPLLGKPQSSLVPGLLVLDYGEALTGEQAWDFLIHQSNLHPRADVVGYRNDGQEDMLPVKKLDLAAPIAVLVFSDDSVATPVACAVALIAPESALIPDRLREYLPCFQTIADWQLAQETL